MVTTWKMFLCNSSFEKAQFLSHLSFCCRGFCCWLTWNCKKSENCMAVSVENWGKKGRRRKRRTLWRRKKKKKKFLWCKAYIHLMIVEQTPTSSPHCQIYTKVHQPILIFLKFGTSWLFCLKHQFIHFISVYHFLCKRIQLGFPFFTTFPG